LAVDLLEWNTLYISGRMHKPVSIIRDRATWHNLNQVNLMHAVKVAMLLLPEEFGERELYMTLCQLSYLGDLRSGIAEDPMKIPRIVDRQMEAFYEYYRGVLCNMLYLDRLSNGVFKQDMTDAARQHLVASLPYYLECQLGAAAKTMDTSQTAVWIRRGKRRERQTITPSYRYYYDLIFSGSQSRYQNNL
jgi:translocator assembly and maintenance protein 41